MTDTAKSDGEQDHAGGHSPQLGLPSQLFVLGDSYSDIGWTYDGSNPEQTLPSAEVPLGMQKPGDGVRWCWGSFQDNWVVHLSRSMQRQQHNMLIYDVALGGASVVSHLDSQVRQMSGMIKSGKVKVSPDALLVIWFGINDVAISAAPPITCESRIYAQQLSTLHSLGFRHLVLFDIPPRRPLPSNTPEAFGIPTSTRRQLAEIATRGDAWNASLLPAVLQQWRQKEGCTGRIFSSYQVFKGMLDHPTQYGFDWSDPEKSQGGIWVDGLHPTAKVHAALAEAVQDFLRSG